MIYLIKCKYCGKEFETHYKNGGFCSDECRRQYFVHKKTVENSEKLKREGIEGKDYVIDRWNGLAVKRIYGSYFKRVHPDRTLDEYKREFPDAKLYSEVDDANVGKSRGLHMKEEKYKKMFSEKFRGENNPMSKSKTTEEFRKSCSPFSPKFYEVRGMGEDDRKGFIRNVIDNRDDSTFNTRVEFYEKRGYSHEDAERELRKRQATKTLEACIKKYGEYGYELYRIRNAEWSNKIEEMYRRGEFDRISKKPLNSLSSEKELKFIKSLIIKAKLDDSLCKYHRTNSAEQLRLVGNGSHYLYDFVYGKKIIEFNGTYWHCDPRFYGITKKLSNGKTATQIWKRDLEKTKLAIENGFEILHVWEYDYDKDEEKVLQECIQFLTT